MNRHLPNYLRDVIGACEDALQNKRGAMLDILPTMVCRELQVTGSPYITSNSPMALSYHSVKRNVSNRGLPLPRKIEFGAAVYLKEGLIDQIIGTKDDATIIVIGDSNSDKRLAYNAKRLLSTFSQSYDFHCFISNSDLVSPLGGPEDGSEKGKSKKVTTGWDDEQLFYHAESWSELSAVRSLIESKQRTDNIILVIDLDGTLMCPRPTYSDTISGARFEALKMFSATYFDARLFDVENPEHVASLDEAYKLAGRTGFSKAFDDADLTALIALGLYTGIVHWKDQLLNPANGLGFVTLLEWLQYADFVMENHKTRAGELEEIRNLFSDCTERVNQGEASTFHAFREKEELVLLDRAAENEVPINGHVVRLIRDAARLGAVPIGFSDRPNASLGLETIDRRASICAPSAGERLCNTPLPLDGLDD
ncbi:MAG: hypothetical protein AAF711_17065 [Planctomycetota bacterium]